MWTNDALYRGFLTQQVGAPPATTGTYADIQAIGTKQFEHQLLLGAPLPADGWATPTVGQWAADQFWQASLHTGAKTRLSFPMIGRLVELLLRLQPIPPEAIRLTYSHLFMDEFQDTTQVQYDLIRTIFLPSDVVVTAVGDNKQQIMRWPMAMADPFRICEHSPEQFHIGRLCDERILDVRLSPGCRGRLSIKAAE